MIEQDQAPPPPKIGRPKSVLETTRIVKIQVAFTGAEAAAMQIPLDELHQLEEASGTLGPSRVYSSRSLFLTQLIREALTDRPTVEAAQRALVQRRTAASRPTASSSGVASAAPVAG